jgi:hypothetical protein
LIFTIKSCVPASIALSRDRQKYHNVHFKDIIYILKVYILCFVEAADWNFCTLFIRRQAEMPDLPGNAVINRGLGKGVEFTIKLTGSLFADTVVPDLGIKKDPHSFLGGRS